MSGLEEARAWLAKVRGWAAEWRPEDMEVKVHPLWLARKLESVREESRVEVDTLKSRISTLEAENRRLTERMATATLDIIRFAGERDDARRALDARSYYDISEEARAGLREHYATLLDALPDGDMGAKVASDALRDLDQYLRERDEARRERDAAIRERDVLVEVLRLDSDCRIIHCNYPDGWTCLDKQRDALAHPERYGHDFRRRLVDGKERCTNCIRRAALAKLDAGPSSRGEDP